MVEGWVASALEGRSVGHNADDVYQGCVAKAMDLWLALEGKKPVACAVTEIRQFPRARVCQMFVIAGTRMAEWLWKYEPVFAEWAREKGCTHMEGAGRRGWERMAPGYEPVYTVMRKALVEG